MTSFAEAPSKPSPQATLLIVDDDPLIADSLGFLLRDDFSIVNAASRTEALNLLSRLASPPLLALVDLGLPPNPHLPDEGFALIGDLLARAPEMRIVVLSGQSEQAHARHARTLGATEFVSKPADPALLRQLLHTLLRVAPAGLASPTTAGLIGKSAALQKLLQQIQPLADSPYPVLIEGESGVGKEIVARHHLHATTTRSQRPFLAVNCAAISPALMESTLFGHTKGAFTGATQAHAGCFEDAQDGTLFLDEVGELPLDLQPKLLRVLENGEFHRVGETQVRRARARIIAATNRDLRLEVRNGHFRSDLYHRLSVFTLNMPALRDMGEDRLVLLEHFANQLARESGCTAFQLEPAAIAQLMQYPFPGNVRELRNIAIRLIARYAGQSVSAEQLMAEFDPFNLATANTHAGSNEQLRQQQLQTGTFNLDHALSQFEQDYIQTALTLARGNMSQAARLLGINRTTLYARMDSAGERNTADRNHREQGH